MYKLRVLVLGFKLQMYISYIRVLHINKIYDRLSSLPRTHTHSIAVLHTMHTVNSEIDTDNTHNVG